MKPEFTAAAARDDHRSKLSLRWRLFSYMLMFAAILIGLLWLFQIVYLDRFYEMIQTERITMAGETLVRSLDDADLAEQATDIAQRQNICTIVLRVYNRELFALGYEQIASLDVNAGCIIHHMDRVSYARIYELTLSGGGAYHERLSRNQFMAAPADSGFWNKLISPRDTSMPDSLIYARIAESLSGDTYFILLNSTITPLTATVETLRIQLLVISAILIVLALVLSHFLALRLSKPITKINAAAHRLAEGDFSGNFDGSGYRETAELAQTLNYAAAELGRADQLQQEITANISHDLRTPLTMIGGYAEFMRDFPEEDHQESLKVIIDETERLARLVTDVLDSSRLSAGVEEMRPTHYDFSASLAALINRYRRLIEPNGYRIQLNQDGEAIVHADEQRMEQVVGNLFNNAVAHAGQDKLIVVNQTRHDGLLRVEISDHGPGIPPEEIPNIWRRYYRTDAPARGTQSSGLGLSIVRGILEWHHARYGVESELGQGSKFWFELPLEP